MLTHDLLKTLENLSDQLASFRKTIACWSESVFFEWLRSAKSALTEFPFGEVLFFAARARADPIAKFFYLQCHTLTLYPEPMAHAASQIRPATINDAPALAELMYLAAQSQYQNSGYDISLGGSRNHQMTELAKLAVAKSLSWFHYSHFYVAETQGHVVAAAAGYERIAADAEINPALIEIGWTAASLQDLIDRLSPVLHVFPPEPPNYWTVDHVAVLPPWRQKGFARACLLAVLQRGTALEFRHAKLDVFEGNIAARSLYQSLGFQLSQTFDHVILRTLLKRDALHRMIRPL